MRTPARIRNDAGQSVVLFVIIMSGLFAIMAFLVNVGTLFQVGHNLQGVADSASLAAASDDVSTQPGGVGTTPRRDFFGGYDAVYGPHGYLKTYAPYVTSGSTCGGFCSDVRDGTGSDKPSSEVDLATNVDIVWGHVLDLVGFNLSSVTLHASSVASTEPPTAIDQIAPLALECDTSVRPAPGRPAAPGSGRSTARRTASAGLPTTEPADRRPPLAAIRTAPRRTVPHFGPIDIPGSSLNDLNCAPLSGPANCNPTEVDRRPPTRINRATRLGRNVAFRAGRSTGTTPARPFASCRSTTTSRPELTELPPHRLGRRLVLGSRQTIHSRSTSASISCSSTVPT